ncbi:MAG: carbon-nitrogen hydrolase family protein [Pseudomonadota bacterium]
MKVACLQMRSGTDQNTNASVFEGMVRKAASHGASYIQSPEMTGIVQRDRTALMAAVLTPGDTPVLQRAERLANELNITVHVGSTAVLRADGALANRAYLFTPQALKPVTYDKIHMFDAVVDKGDTWHESAVYSAGEDAVTAEISSGTLGLSICYDLRFPALYRSLATAGANILTAPSCFTVPTGRAHWHVLIRARAIETGSFMICAAQGGPHEDGRTTYGHSIIVDPWGEVIAELDGDEPGILMADLHLDAAWSARNRVPALQNARSFREPQIHGLAP